MPDPLGPRPISFTTAGEGVQPLFSFSWDFAPVSNFRARYEKPEFVPQVTRERGRPLKIHFLPLLTATSLRAVKPTQIASSVLTVLLP